MLTGCNIGRIIQLSNQFNKDEKNVNIDEMTYGELKQIANLFNKSESSNLLNDAVGKYVIVRSKNEGINAGVVKAADETGIILSDARRIWYHKPKDKKLSWYEGVAESGLSSDSKVSGVVSEKTIIEDYSITRCSAISELSIRDIKANEQN